MTKLSPIKKGIAFQKRETSLFSKQGRRQTRRGQTLVEYALILAYISVVSMQMMDLLGFISQKQYVYVNCVAIVANTNNQNIPAAQNQANEMTAVNNYLTTAFAKYPASWSGPAVTEISNKISGIIYGS